MSNRKERRTNIDTIQAAGLILEHLINLEEEGKHGQTIYGLKTKAFRTSQRDERIKAIVERLLNSGYINSFQSGEYKTLYYINEKGKKFYHDSIKSVMELFNWRS